MLQAETIAQSAERGGKKVIQMEWAGGRNAAIDGPTVDFRTFVSGRGVMTNYVSPSDAPALIAAFGLQYDQAADRPGDRLDERAGVVQRPRSRCTWRCSTAASTSTASTAYIYDSTDDGTVNYDRVLFARDKDGASMVADLRRRASSPT